MNYVNKKVEGLGLWNNVGTFFDQNPQVDFE